MTGHAQEFLVLVRLGGSMVGLRCQEELAARATAMCLGTFIKATRPQRPSQTLETQKQGVLELLQMEELALLAHQSHPKRSHPPSSVLGGSETSGGALGIKSCLEGKPTGSRPSVRSRLP